MAPDPTWKTVFFIIKALQEIMNEKKKKNEMKIIH